MSPGAGRATLTDDAKTGANWGGYAHAEPIVRVLQQVYDVDLAEGRRQRLFTVLHASGEKRPEIAFGFDLEVEGTLYDLIKRLDKAGKDQGVKAVVVTFEEPSVQEEPYSVLARNTGDKPALVLGGTVLVGGERDRLVRRDALLGPGAEVELAALPAASTSDIRKEAVPFDISPALAPAYLRKRADFGPLLSMKYDQK